MLTSEQTERFARQIALPEIGSAGQTKLLAGRVLVIGVGGLGAPAALYLAAAGVGTLGLADGDCLELDNLQRQVLYTTADLGRPKAEAAGRRLLALNPALTIRVYQQRLDRTTALEIMRHYDFIIEATDNFVSKFMIADACHAAGKPYSHGGIQNYMGQTITVLPGRTTCYRCLFEEPPLKMESALAGPLGVVPGVIGTLQAAEAIKYLLGLGKLLTDRLLTFDALTMRFRVVPVKRNPACPLCRQ